MEAIYRGNKAGTRSTDSTDKQRYKQSAIDYKSKDRSTISVDLWQDFGFLTDNLKLLFQSGLKSSTREKRV